MKSWILMALGMAGRVVDAGSAAPIAGVATAATPLAWQPREKNSTIKEGGTPAEWSEQPAKQRQKDVDARWTRKDGERHYGCKNHIKADAKSKTKINESKP